jgi:hypothetical protein
MALGSVKLIKKIGSPQQQMKLIQDQIKRELVPVAQAHVEERNKVTSDFEHEIKFGYRINATDKQVTLTILLKNEGEAVSEGFSIEDLWKSLDKTGTRPHVIRAKNTPRLRFQTNYQPHTRPIGRSGGLGRATGSIVFARQVNHPGYAPRKFSEVINKRLRRSFEQAIDRGIKLGARKRR